VIDYGFGCRLGPLHLATLHDTYNWRNDPKIYRWCRQYEPLEWSNHQDWNAGLKNKSDIKMYSILDKDSTVVGVCGLTSIDLINRHAEFSIYVGGQYQGKNHGEAALKTLCAHGFNAIGLCHIYGETFDGNPASHLFEKVGFQKEGSRRSFYFREGKFIDAHLYSVLSYEFKTKWSC
jgi:RimJ/RimL family protein N-acetyltransferase